MSELDVKRKAYEDARAWLALLIDNPDKTVGVDEYKAQLESARFDVSAAHQALIGQIRIMNGM